MLRRTLAVATTLFVALGAPALAESPRTVHVQFRLNNSAGAASPDQAHSILFRLYDVAAGGTPLWEESASVSTRSGLASYALGSVTPFPSSLAFDRPYYLGVKVGADPEMTPRLPLGSVPFALSADGGGSGLAIPYRATASDPGYLFHITNTDAGSSTDSAAIRGEGVIGVHGEGTRTGVSGRADGSTGAMGVYGLSATGKGVVGGSFAGSPDAFSGGIGVEGYSYGENGFGMYSTAYGAGSTGLYAGGANRGVEGSASGSGGYGVLGRAKDASSGIGVYGIGPTRGVEGYSSIGVGVLGTGATRGVQGYSYAGTGVYGDGGTGVYGRGSRGVDGFSDVPGGAGLMGTGQGSGGYGVWAASSGGTGIYGESTATGSYGIFGRGLYSGATGVAGVGARYGLYGESNGTGVYGNGARGVEGYSSATSGPGVMGTGEGTGGYGLYGKATSGSGVGVYATNTGSNGQAVVGVADNGSTSVGVYGKSSSGYAGYFQGKVHVYGNLSKSSGSFKIDHPLDPANKYLYHSFVESPDMKNIYDGVVTTDGNGEATVALPDWFGTLNSDFRYQLTCIGQFAQAIVSREIEENRFTILTDKPNVKVSWQVTGIRQDAYARDHRIPVEEEKPAGEKGTYLYPPSGASGAASLIAPNGQRAAPSLPSETAANLAAAPPPAG